MKKTILFSHSKGARLAQILWAAIFYLLFSILVVQAALVPQPTGAGGQYTWCDLMQLAKNVLDFAIYLAIPLVVLMIIYGGLMIMFSGGALGTAQSPGRLAQGRKIIQAAVVGLLIVLLSYLILDTIIKIIGQGWQGIPNLAPWNKLTC